MQCQKVGRGESNHSGFSLIELLVVLSVISMLMAVMLPAFGAVKRKAQILVGANNQKQIVTGVNLFAMDNNDRYPPSVATVGFGDSWNWSDPTKLTGNRRRSPVLHRSMSAYLRSYIPDADTMYCPCAPRKYKYLQQAWDAGDDWDNPETSFPSDPVGGTYCFYFNYIGYLGGKRVIFKGPTGPASSRQYSKLLVTDYFGYDHWRSPNAYGSCEKFNSSDITPETLLLSAYWSRPGDADSKTPDVTLKAGYTDGHVESYSSSEVPTKSGLIQSRASLWPMKVSITSDGTVPYPDDVGPGIFYLPTNALY